MTSMVSLLVVVVMVFSFSVDAFQFQYDSIRPNKPKANAKVHNLRSRSRRDVLITITASPLVSLLPQPALAKDESMNYQAVWTDPKHPNGYRILFGDNQNAKLLQRDEPPDDELVLPVKVVAGEEGKDTKLLFGGVEGTFTTNREGTRIISFDNGKSFWINKKFEGPIGVYRDSTNPQRVILIRQIKGSDCEVQFWDADNVTTFTAKAGNIFTFNFPDKGTVAASFSMKKRSLTFEDGTVWSKY